MRKRIDPPPPLGRLASCQGGVVTREQALAHGLGNDPIERLLRTGRWRRLSRGAYFTESGEPPWTSRAWCGVLLGGDRAHLAGRPAGHLHGLIDGPPEVITVLVPHGGPRRPRGPWQFDQARDDVRWRALGQPPMTDLDDTVLDLAEGLGPSAIVDLVTRAVQTRRTTADRLLTRLGSRRRHSRRAELRELLDEVVEGAESPLELRYLTDVERRHGLPHGTRQHRTRGTAQDVWYQAYGAIVELDGRAGHVAAGRHRDMRRDNRSTLSGAATLRYGWWDVTERPCLVAAEVGALLNVRGWSGRLVLCPSCDSSRRSDGSFR